ncbi:hypothetical protein, partial [Helicobacter pylori]|uniref:hypothetical protein n=1 Tax=Helicobacter pylori TaxID=210 RepID=UPI001E56ADBF
LTLAIGRLHKIFYSTATGFTNRPRQRYHHLNAGKVPNFSYREASLAPAYTINTAPAYTINTAPAYTINATIS